MGWGGRLWVTNFFLVLFFIPGIVLPQVPVHPVSGAVVLSMVTHRTVQFLGALFWLCGATSTSIMCIHNLFIYPSQADDAPGATKDPHHFWNWLALSCGVLSFVLFYGPIVFVPLAYKETSRISNLEHPRPWHFFHRWRLLALVTLVPCAVVSNKLLQRHYVADLIFGMLVTPVSLGLWSGGLFVMLRHAIFYDNFRRRGSSDGRETLSLLVGGNDDGGGVTEEYSDLKKDLLERDLGLLGPVVGHYSIEENGTLYDLNDHYSQPRSLYGSKSILVRSPVECLINLLSFFILLVMQVYAAQAPSVLQVGTPDWLLSSCKLLHLFFHAMIHVLPNYSTKKGMNHLKCPRVLCGIIFGLSRYAVM